MYAERAGHTTGCRSWVGSEVHTPRKHRDLELPPICLGFLAGVVEAPEPGGIRVKSRRTQLPLERSRV